MSLKLKLQEAMKEALKNKQKERLSVLRLALASIKSKEIDKRALLTDEEIIDVLAKEVKKREDSILEFQKASRTDLLEKEKFEIQVLLEFLPKQLTKEEVEAILKEAITTLKATSKDFGKVMEYVLPKVRGRVNTKDLSQLLRKML